MKIYLLNHEEIERPDYYKELVEMTLGVFSSPEKAMEYLGINPSYFDEIQTPILGVSGKTWIYTYMEDGDGGWLKRFIIEEIELDKPHDLLIKEFLEEMV